MKGRFAHRASAHKQACNGPRSPILRKPISPYRIIAADRSRCLLWCKALSANQPLLSETKTCSIRSVDRSLDCQPWPTVKDPGTCPTEIRQEIPAWPRRASKLVGRWVKPGRAIERGGAARVLGGVYRRPLSSQPAARRARVEGADTVIGARHSVRDCVRVRSFQEMLICLELAHGLDTDFGGF